MTRRTSPLVTTLLTLALILTATAAEAADPITSLEQVDTWPADTANAPLGLAPLGLALSPDGQLLYAVAQEFPVRGDDDDELVVFDTATGDVVGSAPLTFANVPATHGFPTDVVLSDDGLWAYVAISKADGSTVSAGVDRVDVFDLTIPDAPAYHATIDTSLANPFGVFELELVDGTLYASSRGNHAVVAIDAASYAVSTIGVFGRPTGLDLAPDGSTVWVANRGSVSLAGIDTATDTLASWTPIPLAGVEITAYVAATPDGAGAYVTSAGSGSVAHVEFGNNPPTTIPTGCASLREIETERSSRYAFAVCPAEDQLIVIDIEPGSPTHDQIVHAETIDPARNLGLLVDEHDGLRVYVSSPAARAISVLELTCPGGDLDLCLAIADCEANANNHGQCVSCVNAVVNAWPISNSRAQALKSAAGNPNKEPCNPT